MTKKEQILVFTLKERCKTCYTCVRECPAKAIRIFSGQADILAERCIACGNCVKVCSQGAKAFLKTEDRVMQWIQSGEKVIAMVAPSFPAEFMDFNSHKEIVGLIRKSGFAAVHEVAFGADLVARRFKEMISDEEVSRYITSDCPAIVSFVEKYHSELVDNLVPICSPMVAMARIVRKIHGPDAKLVFIGPCIAKKNESNEVDEAITFRELRQIFLLKKLTVTPDIQSEFDPPLGGVGSIFPVSRGMIQAVDIDDSLYSNNIISAEGRNTFQEALKEFEANTLVQEHLELLSCDGCIMGAGMTSSTNRFAKGSFVTKYVRKKLEKFNFKQWEKDFEYWQNQISLDTEFTKTPVEILEFTEEEIQQELNKIGKKTITDQLNCGACGYDTCVAHAIAILKGLAEHEMCLPYAIEKLHQSIKDLNVSNQKLASAQQALKQSEKLASMGQLSAGIAHELNNPLGVVIMYANILLEEASNDQGLTDDLKLIAEQAERCKKIVGGLLNFARKNQVVLSDVQLDLFLSRVIQSVIIPENIKVEVLGEKPFPTIKMDEEQMMQVFTNIIRNAYEAMPEGGKLTILAEHTSTELNIHITDTGQGISQVHMDKIFEPFFTTKEIGKGTGLGLATAYGIIKMHSGKIAVESNDDPKKGPTGTTFNIRLPLNK